MAATFPETSLLLRLYQESATETVAQDPLLLTTDTPVPQRTSIRDLPSELIDGIMQYLPTVDLLCAGSTCTKWAPIAANLLSSHMAHTIAHHRDIKDHLVRLVRIEAIGMLYKVAHILPRHVPYRYPPKHVPSSTFDHNKYREACYMLERNKARIWPGHMPHAHYYPKMGRRMPPPRARKRRFRLSTIAEDSHCF